jgi:hypothetical protein
MKVFMRIISAIILFSGVVLGIVFSEQNHETSHISLKPEEQAAEEQSAEQNDAGIRSFSDKEIIDSLANAYGNKITLVQKEGNEYFFLVLGSWFIVSNGRLLPAELRLESDQYTRHPFYAYPRDIPERQELDPSEIQRIQNVVAERDENPPRRNPAFFDLIWGIHDARSAEAQQAFTSFLGRQTKIHRAMVPILAAIEAELSELRMSDEELDTYLKNISSVSSFHWRLISGTESRSFHSYGLALDIIPKNYYWKQVYWRWSRDLGINWINLSNDEKFMAPANLVKVFENFGFTWGGKWFLFDTIHFEYRPEILYLNGLIEKNVSIQVGKNDS